MTFDTLVKPILIEALQKVANWYQNDKTYYLRSIFDLVRFIDRQGNEPKYFVSPAILSSRLHHPQAENLENFEEYKRKVWKFVLPIKTKNGRIFNEIKN